MAMIMVTMLQIAAAALLFSQLLIVYGASDEKEQEVAAVLRRMVRSKCYILIMKAMYNFIFLADLFAICATSDLLIIYSFLCNQHPSYCELLLLYNTCNIHSNF